MEGVMESMERVVGQAPSPLRMEELKHRMLERGFEEEDIRAAFWFLLDQERIHWLDDRRVAGK